MAWLPCSGASFLREVLLEETMVDRLPSPEQMGVATQAQGLEQAGHLRRSHSAEKGFLACPGLRALSETELRPQPQALGAPRVLQGPSPGGQADWSACGGAQHRGCRVPCSSV